MGSSILHSLSHALHSLQNPFLSRRSSGPVPFCKDDNPVHQPFDLELCDHLTRLDRADQAYLNLPWLKEAMCVVLSAFSSILRRLPKFSCTEKEIWIVEANLEDSLKLLDVCNGLKEVVNDMQHFVLHVRCAARSAADVQDASDEEYKSKLMGVNDALLKSVEFLHAREVENSKHRNGRSKLETCSSLLRRMGEQLSDARPGGDASALFNDIYASKVSAIFMCSVVATALSMKPQRPLALLHMADRPGWPASLLTLQQNVKKAVDGGIQDGRVVLLKELDEVHACTHEIRGLLTKILDQEHWPADVKRSDLSHQFEMLCKHTDGLQQGLMVLQQNIDDLFRMLVAVRVAFLDALCPVKV